MGSNLVITDNVPVNYNFALFDCMNAVFSILCIHLCRFVSNVINYFNNVVHIYVLLRICYCFCEFIYCG